MTLVIGVVGVSLLLPSQSMANRQTSFPEFIPPEPISDLFVDEAASATNAPGLDFCADWNPEFALNGHRCCRPPRTKLVRVKHRWRKRGWNACYVERWRPNFCADMTEEQREYAERASSRNIPDVLSYLEVEMIRGREQAFCSVNNGFLANGRSLVETPDNRIKLRSPERCVAFGTDPMIAMMEWLGRRVAAGYSAPDVRGVHMLVGDISAPRGGCLAGRSGHLGHASHTNGQDVDIGFIMAYANKESPSAFGTHFDAKPNWWFLKQLFRNPYACIKVVFLDKAHIRKLAKVAWGDEDWHRFGRFIRHVKSHKNHYHVRIGDGPGQPGCSPDAHPELESEDYVPLDVAMPENVDSNRNPAARDDSQE